MPRINQITWLTCAERTGRVAVEPRGVPSSVVTTSSTLWTPSWVVAASSRTELRPPAATSMVSVSLISSGASASASTRTRTGWSRLLAIVAENRPVVLERVTAEGASTRIDDSWREMYCVDRSASAREASGCARLE